MAIFHHTRRLAQANLKWKMYLYFETVGLRAVRRKPAQSCGFFSTLRAQTVLLRRRFNPRGHIVAHTEINSCVKVFSGQHPAQHMQQNCFIKCLLTHAFVIVGNAQSFRTFACKRANRIGAAVLADVFTVLGALVDVCKKKKKVKRTEIYILLANSTLLLNATLYRKPALKLLQSSNFKLNPLLSARSNSHLEQFITS